MPNCSGVAGKEQHWNRLAIPFQISTKEDTQGFSWKGWHKRRKMDHRGLRIHRNIHVHLPCTLLFLWTYRASYQRRKRFHLKGPSWPRGTCHCNSLQLYLEHKHKPGTSTIQDRENGPKGKHSSDKERKSSSNNAISKLSKYSIIKIGKREIPG